MLSCHQIWMMKIGLGIAELWVDKLGWGQIPFSQNYGEYDKHNQYWIFLEILREFNHVTDLMSTTSIITNMFIPNNNKTNHPTPTKLNESVHIQLTVMLHCLYARLPQYTPNGKLDKCCENGIWPHPNLSTHNSVIPNPIFIIQNLWHDNMLTYSHTKYWIHPMTSY